MNKHGPLEAMKWVDLLPTDWKTCRLKHLAAIRYGLSQPPPTTPDGVPMLRATNVKKGTISDVGLMHIDPDEIPDGRAVRLRTNDILVVRSGAYTGDSAIIPSSYDGAIAGYDMVVRTEPNVSPKFVAWALLSVPLLESQILFESMRAAQPHLNAEELGNILVPVPPVENQRRIAAYLDVQTAEIDALIAEKERMLALLEEKRAAVVTHAVTRGLDPNAPLKPSGLDWLGAVPEHWPIMRFKHFARMGNGSTPNRDKPEYWEAGEYPWLNSSVVGDRTVQGESRFVTEIALQECHLPRIEPPALLVAITGQGKTRGRSTLLNFEATINQHLAYIKPAVETADCVYLSYLMDTAYSFIRSDSDGAGSTRGAITCEQLGNFRLPLPPLREQQAILEAIRSRTKRFDFLEQTTSDSIRLLRERRSALITGAVTGQIPLEEMAA